MVKCSICLDKIKSKDVKTTSCKHSFHEECIDKWFQLNYTCPYCRTNLSKPVIRRRIFNIFKQEYSYDVNGEVIIVDDHSYYTALAYAFD